MTKPSPEQMLELLIGLARLAPASADRHMMAQQCYTQLLDMLKSKSDNKNKGKSKKG